MTIPAPGRMVGGFHVLQEGAGRPAVLLEAGIAASSISWSLVQKHIAQSTAVLSYDRLGYGWSEPPRTLRTAANIAEELNEMLCNTGIPGPFIVVGHSYGGLIARLLQQNYPNQVAGLVLLDPVVRSEWIEAPEPRRQMLARGVTLSRRGAQLARIGVVGFALRMLTGGSQRIPRLMAKLTAGNGAGVTDRLAGEVRKMPRELWPSIAQHWSQHQSFQTMADYLENLPASAAQLNPNRPLGDLPITVLSASRPNPEHRREAELSSRGRYIVVPEAGHWIQLDAPKAVIDAVLQMVEEVRSA